MELVDQEATIRSFRDMERLILGFFDNLYTRLPGERFIL